MIKIIPKVEDVADSPEDRLSATSKAFYEKYPQSGEYVVTKYEIEVDTDSAEVTTEQTPYLITSGYKFLKNLYVKLKMDIEKEVQKIREFAEKIENGKEIKIKRTVKTTSSSGVQGTLMNMGYVNHDLERTVEIEIEKTYFEHEGKLYAISEKFKTIDKNEILKKILYSMREKYTKEHIVYDGYGNYIMSMRVAKDEKLPEKFEDFEKIVKKAYGIDNKYTMLEFPEGCENSPVEFWKMRGYDYKPFYKEVDGFAFVHNDFLENFKREEEEKRMKVYKEVIDRVLKMDVWEYDYQFDRIKLKDIPDSLKDAYEEAKEKYLKLEKEYKLKELKKYIENANDFLKNGLYKLPIVIKYPNFSDISLIDPDYYYLKEDAKQAQEKNFKKFGNVLLDAQKLYKELEENIDVIYTKAGEFYADKRDSVWKVEVADELKGRFIGKGGKNINELQRLHNKKIIMIDNKPKKKKSRGMKL